MFKLSVSSELSKPVLDHLRLLYSVNPVPGVENEYAIVALDRPETNMPNPTNVSRFLAVTKGLTYEFNPNGGETFSFDGKIVLSLNHSGWTSKSPQFLDSRFLKNDLPRLHRLARTALGKTNLPGDFTTYHEIEDDEERANFLSVAKTLPKEYVKAAPSALGSELFQQFHYIGDLASVGVTRLPEPFVEKDGLVYIPDATERVLLAAIVDLGLNPPTFVTKKKAKEVVKNPLRLQLQMVKHFVDNGVKVVMSGTLCPNNLGIDKPMKMFLFYISQMIADLGVNVTLQRAGSIVTPSFILTTDYSLGDHKADNIRGFFYYLVSDLNRFLFSDLEDDVEPRPMPFRVSTSDEKGVRVPLESYRMKIPGEFLGTTGQVDLSYSSEVSLIEIEGESGIPAFKPKTEKVSTEAVKPSEKMKTKDNGKGKAKATPSEQKVIAHSPDLAPVNVTSLKEQLGDGFKKSSGKGNPGSSTPNPAQGKGKGTKFQPRGKAAN